MNKIEQLHLQAIESEGYVDENDYDVLFVANTDKAAVKSAEITQEIAVEFAKWIAESGAYPCITPRNKGLYVLDPRDPKDYTPEELFQEFLKTKQ